MGEVVIGAEPGQISVTLRDDEGGGEVLRLGPGGVAWLIGQLRRAVDEAGIGEAVRAEMAKPVA